MIYQLNYLNFAVNFNESEQIGKSIDDGFPSLTKFRLEDDVKDALDDTGPNTVGSFLPGDEDELLAGIMDDFDLSGLPTQLEELDDDFFGSGGGLEIESESHDNLANGISTLSTSDGGSNISAYGFTNGAATVSGEHPYGEHPSRTLFVRNINSNVEDSELKSLFEVLLTKPKLFALYDCPSSSYSSHNYLSSYLAKLSLILSYPDILCCCSVLTLALFLCWLSVEWQFYNSQMHTRTS